MNERQAVTKSHCRSTSKADALHFPKAKPQSCGRQRNNNRNDSYNSKSYNLPRQNREIAARNNNNTLSSAGKCKAKSKSTSRSCSPPGRNKGVSITVLLNRVDLIDGRSVSAGIDIKERTPYCNEKINKKEELRIENEKEEGSTSRDADGDEGGDGDGLTGFFDSPSISSINHCRVRQKDPRARRYHSSDGNNRDHNSGTDSDSTNSTNSSLRQVEPYHFLLPIQIQARDQDQKDGKNEVIVHVQRLPSQHQDTPQNHHESDSATMDYSIPNPHTSSVVHDKYWCQRRRLFKRFDEGIQLDSESWYSVTPEVIANHVAGRVGEIAKRVVAERRLRSTLGLIPGNCASSSPGGVILLDAFCGCGGNSIAFGRIDPTIVSLVVCVDVDRNKLRMAAHNASLYRIPTSKLVFIECNSLHVLDRCYRNGERIVSRHASEGPSALFERHAGYLIGGIELLPSTLDMVFMDPPWGGIDYHTLGRNGYDLHRHMKIRYGGVDSSTCVVEGCQGGSGGTAITALSLVINDGESLNKKTDPSPNFVDGVELLRMAAIATGTRLVIYDLPRNTDKKSLGRSANLAGYGGNVKLEQHYLNGRLKTVTAYLGSDHRMVLPDGEKI